MRVGAFLAAVAALLVVALGGVEPRPAEAAMLGENGRIAFVSYRLSQFNRDRDDEIFTVKPDGTGLRQITHNAVNDEHPTWSPDGTRIAYSVISTEGSHTDIRVMNADGTDARVIVDSPEGRDYGTAWSPDGRRIAFVSDRDGYPSIYVANADGTEQRQLTYAWRYADGSPSWSPDGQSIAFYSGRDGQPEIYVMDPDGANERRVTNTPDANEFAPDYSPDGQRILFTRLEGEEYGDADLFTVAPDGTDERPATHTPGFYEMGASYSPDGRKLTFFGISEETGTFNVFTANADGSSVAPLWRGSYVDDLSPDWGSNTAPQPADPPIVQDTAPDILRIRPAWNSATRDRTPRISAVVRDFYTELEAQHIRMWVDGRRVTKFRYDPRTDVLVYVPPRMKRGWHDVRIEARDAVGNTNEDITVFKVR